MSIDGFIVIVEFVFLLLLSITFGSGSIKKLGNSKFKNFFIYIKAFSNLIFIGYILLGSILYIRFVFRELKDLSSPFAIILITIVSFVLISFLVYHLIRFIKNYKNKKDPLYYREVPEICSTAMASYLINQKIEKQKDLFSTILNLVAKRSIDIIPESNDYTYKKLDNNVILNNDEKYVYDWLFSEDKNQFSLLTWQGIIKKELLSKGLIEEKQSKKKRNILIFFIWFFIYCVIGILHWKNIINNQTFDAFLAIILYPFIIIIPGIAVFEKLEIKIDNYVLSQKGKEVYAKLKSLKRFLKDFSIISERKSEEVYIWDEYLAFALVLDVNINYKNIKSLKLPFLDRIQKKQSYEDFINKLANIDRND